MDDSEEAEQESRVIKSGGETRAVERRGRQIAIVQLLSLESITVFSPEGARY